MSKYIDAVYFCEKICRCKDDSCDKSNCPILNAPTADVVEVVRCKDCKYCYKMGVSGLYWACKHPDRNPNGCSPNDYCNYGEREY